MQMVIDRHGRLSCLYSEEIDLHAFGPIAIRRASHVEPDGDGSWWADLSPVNGPKLGPFPLRTQALDAEIAWLEAHWLQPSTA